MNSNLKKIIAIVILLFCNILLSAETVYPTLTGDTWAWEQYPSEKFDNQDKVQCGEFMSGYRNWAYIKFDIGSLDIPEGAEITSASLYVYCNGLIGTGGDTRAYRIYEKDWDESTLTWDNRPDYYKTGYASKTVNSVGWKYFSVKPIVTSWLSGTNPNYGFVINHYSTPSLISFDDESSNNKPYLKINYNIPNNPPIAPSSDISNLPGKMYAGVQYSVSAKYYDEDGADDLHYCYLRLNHPQYPLTMMWDCNTGSHGPWAGNEGENFITLDNIVTQNLSTAIPGYEVTWTFTINSSWSESNGGIQFGVYAEDDKAEFDGWNYKNENQDFLHETVSIHIQDNLPEKLYPGEQYNIYVDYTDALDKNNFNVFYLRIEDADNTQKPITLMYSLDNGYIGPWDGEEGSNYLAVQTPDLMDFGERDGTYETNNNVRIIWHFVIDTDWPENNNVAIKAYAKNKNEDTKLISSDKIHSFIFDLRCEIGDVIFSDHAWILPSKYWHSAFLWFYDNGNYFIRQVRPNSKTNLGDAVKKGLFVGNFATDDNQHFIARTNTGTINYQDRISILNEANKIYEAGPFGYELELTEDNDKYRCDEYIVVSHQRTLINIGPWEPGMAYKIGDEGIKQPRDLFIKGKSPIITRPYLEESILDLDNNCIVIKYNELIGISSTDKKYYSISKEGGAECLISASSPIQSHVYGGIAIDDLFTLNGKRYDAEGCSLFVNDKFVAGETYKITVSAEIRDLGGNKMGNDFDTTLLSHDIVNISNFAKSFPKKLSFIGSSPNPFNSFLSIDFYLPTSESKHQVNILIYDINGCVIRNMIKKAYGFERVIWNGKDDYGRIVPNGQYIITIVSSKSKISKKVTLLK